MPSLFNVTAATNTLVLDTQRQGRATFTVANTGGRQVRGRARVASDQAAILPWLSVVEPAERDFAIAAAEQMAVQVVVPAGAAAGSYSFRLDMVEVTNPDENYTQGPSVQFQVAPAPPPRPFPWWIVALVAAVVVVGGVLVYLFTRQPPTPPEPTPTDTPTLTATPLPTDTPTLTATPRPSETPTPTNTPLPSPFTSSPPTIDGVIGVGEWDKAPLVTELPHGRVLYLNDNTNLYLLLDVTGETVNNAPGSDYFAIPFDVNENRAIDPNVDLMYGLKQSSHDLVISKYLGSGSFTGIQPTSSALGAGFGRSSASSTPHRIWELAIRLSEIQASAGDTIRLGVRVNSPNPGFTDTLPANMYNSVSDLLEIPLGRRRFIFPVGTIPPLVFTVVSP